ATLGGAGGGGGGGSPACRYDHPLPPGEAGKRRQDAVADLDVLHPWPHGENAADTLIADDDWNRGAQCIDALCEQEVARLDGGKLDPDEDLVRVGSVGLGNVDILKTVDRVGGCTSQEARAKHAKITH